MRDWITNETETSAQNAPRAEFDANAKINDLQAAIETVIKGKSETVKFALVINDNHGFINRTSANRSGKQTFLFRFDARHD